MKTTKTEILLIYPKTNPYPHTVSTPLSIFALGSYLERNAIIVDYFDERVQPLKSLKISIEKKPLLVGISCMTGYQIQRAISISKYIKEKDNEMLICWGGTHPSMLPIQTLHSEYIDYVIKGEGEETLHELYKVIVSKDKPFHCINGLYWKDDGRIIENQERSFLDVNKLPSPYESDKIKDLSKRFFLNKKNKGRFTFGYEISRGCRNDCSFCYEPLMYKHTIRVRIKELYKKDLLELKSLGIKSIFFYDNHVSISDEFVRELCEVMKDLDMEWTGGFRVNYLRDKNVVEMLEQSKCRNLFFGIESIEDDMLKLLNKGQNCSLIKNAVDLMSKSTMRPTYSFLTALPFEKDIDMNRLLDFIDDIIKDNPKAEIAIQPYTPLPGTLLFKKSIERGFKLPKKLEDYQGYTTGDTIGPWVKNDKEILNIFLISFLIFRARYFLNKIIFFPLIKLAEIRWKKRFFKIPIERLMYQFFKKIYLWFDELKWLVQKYL
jgi:radical SAM superfamily enzyme YgiQ (UPF0313 family)